MWVFGWDDLGVVDGGSGDGVRTWDFFVSYTSVDERWAEWVAWQLEDAGYRVLIQAWDFVPGSDWYLGMQQGVTHAQKMIALLSPGYLKSVYGGQEWRAVLAADPIGFTRKLLPVRIEECDRPGLLRTVVGFDLFDLEPEAARAHLLQKVSHSLSGRAKPATAPKFPVPARSAPPVDEPAFPPAPEPLPSPAPFGAPRATLTGHTDRVWWVVFSPDGTLLATASFDRTARLWDVATGHQRATLTAHTGPVRWVAFSPDGTLLATAS
ncbi:WD domain, G-beta repeat-containing protein, partial [Frankia sp. CpI1-P]